MCVCFLYDKHYKLLFGIGFLMSQYYKYRSSIDRYDKLNLVKCQPITDIVLNYCASLNNR